MATQYQSTKMFGDVPFELMADGQYNMIIFGYHPRSLSYDIIPEHGIVVNSLNQDCKLDSFLIPVIIKSNCIFKHTLNTYDYAYGYPNCVSNWNMADIGMKTFRAEKWSCLSLKIPDKCHSFEDIESSVMGNGNRHANLAYILERDIYDPIDDD